MNGEAKMAGNEEFFLSVIIPAYNEEARLGPTLDAVMAFLKRCSYRSEIVVVDDGSSDRTSEVAQQKLSGFAHQIMKNNPNLGKGGSVKKGMLAGKGKFLLFTDADLSTPIEEIEKVLKALEKGYDIVLGSRALPDSNVEIKQNVLRQSMGKIFNLFARALAFQNIKDSQCGFKCFKRQAAQDLFSRQKLMGFGFDAEIVFLAQRLKYRILEMPVIWRNSPNSRVHVIKDSLNMFLDLFRIRWAHRNL